MDVHSCIWQMPVTWVRITSYSKVFTMWTWCDLAAVPSYNLSRHDSCSWFSSCHSREHRKDLIESACERLLRMRAPWWSYEWMLSSVTLVVTLLRYVLSVPTRLRRDSWALNKFGGWCIPHPGTSSIKDDFLPLYYFSEHLTTDTTPSDCLWWGYDRLRAEFATLRPSQLPAFQPSESLIREWPWREVFTLPVATVYGKNETMALAPRHIYRNTNTVTGNSYAPNDESACSTLRPSAPTQYIYLMFSLGPASPPHKLCLAY